jgi:isopenicillin-N epimerase
MCQLRNPKMTERFWNQVRNEFDLDPQYVHLVGFWLSSHPRRVRQEIDRHRAALDANPFLHVIENEDTEEQRACTAIADLIGARSDEIILTRSTSEGLALVYGSLSVAPDAEVLSFTHDHYSSQATIEQAVRRNECRHQKISLYTEEEIAAGQVSPEDIIARFANGITDATRLVACTWVHSGSGVRLPLHLLAPVIRRTNADRPENARLRVCVDATHAFGAIAFQVSDLGCDFLVASCHKWLNGPRGTAFVWCSGEVMLTLRQLVPTFARSAIDSFVNGVPVGMAWGNSGAMLSPGGFHAFEHRWSIAAAAEFVTEIGMSKIEQRIQYLSEALRDGLRKTPRVTVLTPNDRMLSAGIVCFRVDGLSVSEAAGALRRNRVLASVSPYPEPCLRFACSVYNNDTDIDRAVSAVRDVSAT